MLKRVRLAALRDAPYAFGSTYEKERQWDDGKWRQWAISSDTQVVLLASRIASPLASPAHSMPKQTPPC